MKCRASFVVAAVLCCLAVRVRVHAAPQYKDAIKPCAHHHTNNNHFHSHHIDAAEAAALVQSQSVGRIVNHGDASGQQHHHNVDIGLETAASATQAVTVNTQIAVGDSTAEAGATQTFRAGEGYVQGSGNAALLPQLPPLPQAAQQPPLPHPAQQFQQQQHHHQHHHHHHVAGAATSQHQNFGASALGQQHLSQGYNYQVQNSQHHQQQQAFNGFATAGSSFSPNAIAPPAPRPSYGAPPPRGPPPPHFNGPAPYRPLGPVGPGPIANIGGPRPVQHFSAGNQFNAGGFQHQAAGSSYAGAFAHNTHGGVQQQHHQGHSSGQASQATQLFGGASLGSSSALNGQLGHVIRETFATAPLDPTVEKHIYVHVPPEELEERGTAFAPQSIPQAPAKKHYKIIFIKAPTVPAPNYAQLAAATQQTEEKTLVYVLVKKPDEPSVEELQQLQQQSIKSSKPEVYFIKYKTRKEGEHIAQPGPVFTGSEDLSPQIDIRFNGGSGAVTGIGESAGIGAEGISTSSSYSSTSSSSSSIGSTASASNVVSVGNSHGPQPHELYGVPLQ